jgi:predicted phage baseplate assembly protein
LAITLDGLYPGIEAGRRILVTGTRCDLPGGATVAAGEAAMVAGVTHQPAAGAVDTAHITLELAAPLAYSYELATVRVYGNVAPGRHGATVTELLEGAAPGDAHPTYTLSQAPVLADPSPTSSGFASTLQLSVGGRTWNAVTRLDASTPPDSYLTGIDSQGRTTITLAGPLPTGTTAVVATYRSGHGDAGNVRAHQVKQLLSQPLTVAGVANPLPASGGSGGDGPADLRAGAPIGLSSLGRLVSVSDAADLVRSWAGVGKASAVWSSDGVAEVLAVTVAGVETVALDPTGALPAALADALGAAGDPGAPIVVLCADLYLIVIAATVRSDPRVEWSTVSVAVRAALNSAFGYRQRRLDQDVAISDIVAVGHSVAGVDSFTVTAVTLIPTTATAQKIADLTENLPPPPASGRLALPGGAGLRGPRPAAVAFVSATAADTVILQQAQR